MTKAQVVVASLLAYVLSASQAAGAKDRGEPLPPRVRNTIQYLKELAPSKPGSGAQYKLRKAVDLRTFAEHIFSKGLVFSDVSGGAPGLVGWDRLEQELRSERGLAYRYLVGLCIDAAGYRDLSHLRVERERGTVRVVLSSYTLTFSEEAGALRLSEIQYTDPGGD